MDSTGEFASTSPATRAASLATGVPGLDDILGGGLPREHIYLLEGDHGTGKTTLALQFCMAGAERGERVLYLSTTESESEIQQIARSHGWSLDGVSLHYFSPQDLLGEVIEQSVFHPAEVELPRTVERILSIVDRVNPERLVIDSLSELRLMAADPRWFRRQTLVLRDALVDRRCTTLFCGERPEPAQTGKSLVHGVIQLEQVPTEYGPVRRRVRIIKIRGQSFLSGYHDLQIRTGGVEIYPRVTAAEYPRESDAGVVTSGIMELDTMFRGGLQRGTTTLLQGPSGTGKSSVAIQYVVAAGQRGERSAVYAFDEQIRTARTRAESLGIDLRGAVERGVVELQQINVAELSAGQFSNMVQRAVRERNVRLVVIDSVAGYFHAMSNERSLVLHLYELLSALTHQQVNVLMVMTQHGLPGIAHHAPVDISYVADSVLLFHVFEYAGELRRAISVYKNRSGDHESALRELQFSAAGIRIGGTLRQFQGVLSGTPRYVGELPDVKAHDQS